MAITDRDVAVLVWVGRHGVVTAEQVRGRFFGDVSAAYRRLRVLEKAGMLRHERVLFGEPGVYRVTGPGLEVAGAEMSPARIDVGMLQHDLALVDLSEILLGEVEDGAGGDVRWVTERELRSKLLASRLSEETGLIGGAGTTRIPDGVLVLGDGRRVAVELERTRKDRGKWQRILGVYIKRRDIDEVRFYFYRGWARQRAEEIGRRVAERAGMPEGFFRYLMYPGFEGEMDVREGLEE